jgi:streptomycin 6-kinase
VPPELELSSNLVEAAAQDLHDRRRAWIGRLPEIVAGLAARWQLTLEPPFQPGGECSWTAPARDAAGRDLVLKVGWTHDEGVHEGAALRLWAGRGAVRLVAEHVDGETTTLLLERARPGTELGRSLPEEEQDVVVAGLLRGLWAEPPAGHAFRPLAEMCEAWAREHEEHPDHPLDPGIARDGLALWRSLPGTADRELLLLTDLHAGNVLAAEREPWLVIDPKPYVGDLAYDPLQHLLNCLDRLSADPSGLADRMADLCGIDRERFRLWLFARCVVESPWWPELAPIAVTLAP